MRFLSNIFNGSFESIEFLSEGVILFVGTLAMVYISYTSFMVFVLYIIVLGICNWQNWSTHKYAYPVFVIAFVNASTDSHFRADTLSEHNLLVLHRTTKSSLTLRREYENR